MPAAELGELDPASQTLVAIIGRKGSGKSKLARWIASSWPYDQLVIDLHGVDRPAELDDPRSGYTELHGDVATLPARWPEHARAEDRPMVLYYQPDVGSPTLLEDMDAAVGLAYRHGRCLVVVHEWGALAVVHRTPPMTARLLSQGRGRNVSGLLLMHRPHNIDAMTLVQADVVLCFEVPKRADRERIADDIGWDQQDFEAGLEELPPYGYLQFDRRVPRPAPGETDLRLLSYPPLGAEELAELERGPAPAHLGDPQPAADG